MKSKSLCDGNDGEELTSATSESNEEDDTHAGSHAGYQLSLDRHERMREELLAHERSNLRHMTADQLDHLKELRLAQELQEEKVRRSMSQSDDPNEEMVDEMPLLPTRMARQASLPAKHPPMPKGLTTVSPRDKPVN